jgi:hypothetical protein
MGRLTREVAGHRAVERPPEERWAVFGGRQVLANSLANRGLKGLQSAAPRVVKTARPCERPRGFESTPAGSKPFFSSASGLLQFDLAVLRRSG